MAIGEKKSTGGTGIYGCHGYPKILLDYRLEVYKRIQIQTFLTSQVICLHSEGLNSELQKMVLLRFLFLIGELIYRDNR